MVLNQIVNLDLETQELQIKTDSALYSYEKITIILYAGDNISTYLIIAFMETIKYLIGLCMIADGAYIYGFHFEDFDSTPTSEINKIWRVTEKSDHSELYIYCNDKLVLTYVYARGLHQPSCVDDVGASDISAIQLWTMEGNGFSDTASDFYRVVGNNLSYIVSDFYRVVGNNLSYIVSDFYRVVGNNLSYIVSDFYRVVGNNLSDIVSDFYRVVGNNLSYIVSVFYRVV